MPVSLLPASAAAFAPRSAPTVVLNSKVEPWLTQTLKRINRVKRPLNSVPQHSRCLTETLSGPAAIWTLCSMMLPKAPDADLRKDANPLLEALFNYQLHFVEAYVVHVDMVSQHEVAFKLTPETIDALVEYHREIYSVDVASSTWDWPEKEEHVRKLQRDFMQAVNRYVFRTGVRALEGMEEDGAGELLEGRSEDVKLALTGLFLPLLPPPPPIVDVVQQQNILPVSTVGHDDLWHPHTVTAMPSQMQQHNHPHQQPFHSAPVDPWRIVPSFNPSPGLASAAAVETQQQRQYDMQQHEQHQYEMQQHEQQQQQQQQQQKQQYQQHDQPQQHSFWASLSDGVQLPSPTPSYSQPYCSPEGFYSSSPESIAAIPVCLPTLPSLLAHQCGSSMVNHNNNTFGGFGGVFGGGYNSYTGGFGGFDWGRAQYASQLAAIM